MTSASRPSGTSPTTRTEVRRVLHVGAETPSPYASVTERLSRRSSGRAGTIDDSEAVLALGDKTNLQLVPWIRSVPRIHDVAGSSMQNV
jgi:hypothetical protein